MPEILLNVFYGVLGGFLLYYGAEFLLKGGVRIAEGMGVPPLIIGLTLVSFATSAPELVVSVEASLEGSGDISAGNIIGSNICNIALILGLCAMITPLKVDAKLVRFDTPLMILVTLVFSGVFFFCGGIGRVAGACFFLGLLTYTFYSIWRARRDPEALQEAESAVAGEEDKEKKGRPISIPVAILFVAGGLAALIFGAKVFLMCAVFFARLLEVSEAVIGLTIVAVGTSLPELSTSVVAALKNQKDIAIGNVVGSNIFNILGIMGIAPLLRPIRNVGIHPVDLGMLLFCSILLLPVMRTGFVISRIEGAFFFLIYCAYTCWLVAQAGVF